MKKGETPKQGFNHIMHGLQGLEQISEKIAAEYLSQDEDDEEESKVQSPGIPQYDGVTQKKGSEQEEIDRITDEIMKKFCPSGHVPRCLVDIKGHKSIFSQDFLQNAEEEKNSTE
jgi:hypothetical protein